MNKSLFSQITKLRGKVVDARTQMPLSFVNIAFKGTNVGTITDYKGNYFLETRTASDSLHVSFVGYRERIYKIKKGVFQSLKIELHANIVALEEVKILPDDNPAHILLKKIIAHKKKNNPARLNSYQYETYTKMELDLNNIDANFKEKKIMKQFQFVFDYVDTSLVSGKSYLPVFITESLSNYYYQKNPKLEREVIKASQMSGVNQNTSLAQFTGQLHQKINVYDNFIDLFNKGFVSPIADGALSYYKYYLTDSINRDGNWCYQISYRPKRKLDLCFVGDFWVADSSFALESIKMRITKDVNLNWVKDLVSTNKYEKINDSTWFLKKQDLLVDFTLTNKDSTSQMGLFGRKTISYRDVKINLPIRKEIIKLQNNVVVKDDALGKSSAYWDTIRPFKLSKRESGIYSMVDSIQNVPLYRNIVDVIKTFITGYYVRGNFEIGPYFKLYSFNEIEGNRFMFGGRTSNTFSEKIMCNAHLAYGDKDKRFKYGLGFVYMLDKLPRESFGMQWKHDIHQLGKSPNAFTESNILASLLKRNPNNKLTMMNQFEAHYEKEWLQGFINTIKFRYRDISSTHIIPFVKPTGVPVSGIKASEIEVRTRWTKNEKVIMGAFERKYLGGPVPIINLYMTMGFKGLLGSNYEYFKTDISIDHTLKLAPLGKMRYMVTASKLWGKVPYPLLSLHEGNETYAFDPFAFNMMNYFEFASDQYLSLYLEHHFQGLIMNRIPLFKKLKWRAVASAKGLWGTLSDKNNGGLENSEAAILFPAGLSDVEKPYFEASVGIENIFKFFRVDAMWRLNHLEPKANQKFEKFGIRAMFQMTF